MFPLGKASGCRTMWPTCSSDLSSAWRTTSWRSRFSSSSHTMSRPTIRTCGYGGWRHGKSHEFQGKDPREDGWNRRRWETNRKREEKNIHGKTWGFHQQTRDFSKFFPHCWSKLVVFSHALFSHGDGWWFPSSRGLINTLKGNPKWWWDDHMPDSKFVPWHLCIEGILQWRLEDA